MIFLDVFQTRITKEQKRRRKETAILFSLMILEYSSFFNTFLYINQILGHSKVADLIKYFHLKKNQKSLFWLKVDRYSSFVHFLKMGTK